MIRELRLLMYFFVGFMLSAVSLLSYAETIPANTETVTNGQPTGWKTQGNLLKTSALLACQDWGGSSAYVVSTTGGMNGAGYCRVGSYETGGSLLIACAAGSSANASGLCTGTAYICPAGQNWTLSGANCTRPDCAAGTTRGANGVCSTTTNTCAALVVTSTGSCVKSIPCGPDSTLPLDFALLNAPICSDQKKDETNCAASGGIVVGMFNGKPICLSPPPKDDACAALGGVVNGTLNGQPICSKASGNPLCSNGTQSSGTVNGQPVCQMACPSGELQGSVNGVAGCYPAGKTTDKSTTQKSTDTGSTKTTTTTGPAGSGTSTSTESSSTTCTGERCTTKTTTTDGAGNEKTETTEADKGDFCSKYPKSTVCTGESEQDKYCTDNPDSLSCLETGTPTEEGALSTVDKSLVSSITPVNIASMSGCPADVQLGKGVYMTYSGICQYAEGLRPIVLASAWLIAGLIVLGMAKQ